MIERAAGWLARVAPWSIIGGLAYAAAFVQVQTESKPMAQPLVESRDLFFGGTALGERAWIVGQHGAVLSGDRAAGTWQRRQLEPAVNLQAITAAPGGRVVAVGNGGRLWTGDGDGTWSPQTLPVSAVGGKLLDAAFVGGHFWVVGEMGALFRGDADGAQWTRMREEDDVAFNAVREGPGASIWVAAEFGRLLSSHDGGETWQVAELGEESLRALAFHGQDGVAVGNRGLAFATTDGGLHWQRLAAFTTEHLYDVAVREGRWLAIGDRGAAFTSSSGLRDWQPLAAAGLGRSYYSHLFELANGDTVLVGRSIGLLTPDGRYRPWPEESAR